jgi:hypothetical protein
MSSRPQATPAKLSAQDPEHRSERTCKREPGFRNPVWESMAKALGRGEVAGWGWGKDPHAQCRKDLNSCGTERAMNAADTTAEI